MRVEEKEITDDFGEMLVGGQGKINWLSRGEEGIVIGGNSTSSELSSDGAANFSSRRARSSVFL